MTDLSRIPARKRSRKKGGGASRYRTWDESFAEYSELAGRLGAAPTKYVVDPDQRRIASWAGRQRQKLHGKVAGKLTADQRELLEATPGWTWGGYDWQVPFDFYCAVAQKLGRYPRKDSADPEERRAAVWADSCRSRRAGTHPAALAPRQIAMLQAAPFWFWTTSVEDRFQDNLDRYRQAAERTGRAPRVTRADREESRASCWVYRMRQRRLGNRPGALTKEQIEQIEALPFWRWTTASIDGGR